MANEKGLVLVTGSSSGIGAAYAKSLAARGYDLILVARRRDRLEALASSLVLAHGIRAEVFVADLSDPRELRRAEQHVAGQERLTMLVNNAGLGGIKPFLEIDREYIQKLITVNVTALTLLTYAALPGMLRRGSGTIINVASGLAYTHMPGVAVYGPTKSYVVHFTRLLHDEYGAQGIRFQAFLPGLTRTELGAGQQPAGFMENFPADKINTPERAAETSLAGLELGELVCIPGMPELQKFTQADRALQDVFRKVTAAAAKRYRPYMSKGDA
jgi:short-subunit dehydrogenase